MKLMLKNPVVIARKGPLLLLAEVSELESTSAIGQFWSETRGYSSVWPMQDLRNLMTIQLVEPPVPWQESARG